MHQKIETIVECNIHIYKLHPKNEIICPYIQEVENFLKLKLKKKSKPCYILLNKSSTPFKEFPEVNIKEGEKVMSPGLIQPTDSESNNS